jgi:peptide methionine sulfoxide reductase msrA/msrB
MGGVSTGKMEFVRMEEKPSLHMKGNVSLENNGGFIQCRTGLSAKTKYFDAGGFDGIYLRSRGNRYKYAIHLRTSNTWLPWQFYQADFQNTENWKEVKIPFSEFKPVSLRKKLNIGKLKTVAIVAIKKEFKADIFVNEIGFYKDRKMYKKLTPEEERVIINKGTERPFTGKYYKHFQKGTYTCKRCGAALFESSSKFKSNCGWPSFDDQIAGAVKRLPDKDARRTEIVCSNCAGHLGHVFLGEGFTEKNTRYCANSISMDFIPAKEKQTDKAIFAGGCFWGVEYHFQRAPGVIAAKSGYTGGHVDNPTYKQVCTGKTGHAEAIEVMYDPNEKSYEQLTKRFFEIHDFTQHNRQGPDIGTQYRSVIYYLDDQQKETADRLIEILKQKGYDVKTAVEPAKKFYHAEKYHQDYYNKNKKTPYCHIYKKIF